ncbi:MAG TPA: DUF488 domain-containing protein [Tepidiformaceae bacterium]|nr:DUF488 domain-containing protein [Tepidiformaceae bacterium]
MLRIKRVYEEPSPSDGLRILVDRIWPRGMSKDRAHVDRWDRDLGPSNELRKWFGHDPALFDEFARRYRAELREQAERIAEIRSVAAKQTVTLVYSARDEQHNQAVVLAAVIGEM